MTETNDPSVENQPTCGKGLAQHSVLPAKLGDLTAAMAENLEVHMQALDLTDENSKKEYDAYVELAREHRRIAGELRSTARQMAAYRDLPMGRHDEKAMAAPEAANAFEKFVRAEQDILALLQRRVAQDQKVLTEMRGGGNR